MSDFKCGIGCANEDIDRSHQQRLLRRLRRQKTLNTREYIILLRKDVSAEKARLLGTVMQFDAEDAAKFWPIYRDYDVELNKLNDLRVANIQEYAQYVQRR